MIIVVGKWKEKVAKMVAVVVLAVVFAAAIPMVSGILYKKVPVFSGWFDDEHPSGNPMRVDKNNPGGSDLPENKFNEKMDRFVVKVQNFYYEEKE
ncbi:Uncharacterized [Syntrophomonas zehnderi OL-4]|uniref:Uncharacterized n=1 Tax=Syntrophomonas zehnderi OL-4 TaxID=690567 RepID=A0A0E4GAH8_9FIRM|nr:hypothetical protein [Syntrophomonas zehnderi]CFX50861.1 Uncharacterized [Syntrophomonas zehnderi OL-4]